MKILKHVQYTGRKSKTGKICFDENGRMVVFIDYCPDCRGKIVLSKDEACNFAKQYGAELKRRSNRLLDWLVRRKRIPETPLEKDTSQDKIKEEILSEIVKKLQLH